MINKWPTKLYIEYVLNYVKSICKERKGIHFQIICRIRITGNFYFLLIHTFCCNLKEIEFKKQESMKAWPRAEAVTMHGNREVFPVVLQQGELCRVLSELWLNEWMDWAKKGSECSFGHVAFTDFRHPPCSFQWRSELSRGLNFKELLGVMGMQWGSKPQVDEDSPGRVGKQRWEWRAWNSNV